MHTCTHERVGAFPQKLLFAGVPILHPEVVGQKRKVVFGDTSLHGEAARARLDALGLKYSPQDVDTIIGEIRKLLPIKKSLTLEEFDEVARQVLKTGRR